VVRCGKLYVVQVYRRALACACGECNVDRLAGVGLHAPLNLKVTLKFLCCGFTVKPWGVPLTDPARKHYSQSGISNGVANVVRLGSYEQYINALPILIIFILVKLRCNCSLLQYVERREMPSSRMLRLSDHSGMCVMAEERKQMHLCVTVASVLSLSMRYPILLLRFNFIIISKFQNLAIGAYEYINMADFGCRLVEISY
jgi:hypothetical protein